MMTYNEQVALGTMPPPTLVIPERSLVERVALQLECDVDWAGFLDDGTLDWYLPALLWWRELHGIEVPVNIYQPSAMETVSV
jgi:hypothetical protein